MRHKTRLAASIVLSSLALVVVGCGDSSSEDSDSDVFRVAYRYSPINDKGNELSLLLGAHYTTFDTAISSSLA